MEQRTALLLGATGLTGNLLLNLLLQSPNYQKVTIYVRKSINLTHPKLIEQIIDFETIDTSVNAEDIFCCLGTTIKIAKTKEAFEKVDLHYPIKIAQLQKNAGSKQFLVVSAMGANVNSSIFYSKTKGLMETGLQKIGFDSLHILRPSFIDGERKEKRLGEKIGLILFSIVEPLLVGPLRNYTSVKASAIAACMLQKAIENNTGTFTILSGDIKKWE